MVIKKKSPLQHNYLSEADRLINDFNEKTPLSPAQQDEVDKYKAIHEQRDQIQKPKENESDIWE